MSFEIRPVHIEEIDEFKRVAGAALIMKPSAFEGMRPEWTLAGFEDGRLATTFGAWPFIMRFNGAAAPVSGVTSVGTLPVYRRRGHLRKIMTRHFEILHEQEQRHIASLWASWAAIYQRFGYGIIATRFSYTIEPRYIQFPEKKAVQGQLHYAGSDEFDLLSFIYGKFIEDRNGYVMRAKPMWDYGVLSQPPPGGTLSKVIYEENGEPKGYLIYHTIPRPSDIFPDHRLAIRDLAWLNGDAYRAFWEHLAQMDLIQEIIWQRAPADDPAPHLILEPRRLKAQAVDSLLNRLVTVEKALAQRKYQADGELTFEMVDKMCPWNTGKWKLETSAQGSKVSRTKQSAQLTVPESALALLAFGQISATEAARMGRLDVHDASSLPVWDNVMRTMYKAACPDMF